MLVCSCCSYSEHRRSFGCPDLPKRRERGFRCSLPRWTLASLGDSVDEPHNRSARIWEAQRATLDPVAIVVSTPKVAVRVRPIGNERHDMIQHRRERMRCNSVREDRQAADMTQVIVQRVYAPGIDSLAVQCDVAVPYRSLDCTLSTCRCLVAAPSTRQIIVLDSRTNAALVRVMRCPRPAHRYTPSSPCVSCITRSLYSSSVISRALSSVRCVTVTFSAKPY